MSQIRIKVLIPNSGMDQNTLEARKKMLSKAVSPQSILSVECIPAGPLSIESVTDEVSAAPYLLNAGRQAQQDGYHAFVVYCFSDLAGIDYSIEALRKHPEWVEQAHKLGLEVNVWTVDKEEDMRYFIDLGVDYITTNYPEQLQQLIGEK